MLVNGYVDFVFSGAERQYFLKEVCGMQSEKHVGYVKKETMYVAIGACLLIGFLSGVVFTIYKSPGGSGGQAQNVAQQQNNGQDLAALEKQAAESPDDPEIWTHLGHAYFDADDYAKAINAYSKSLELAPGNADVLTDLGVMYRRNGQPDKALESFNKAIAASPNHEQPRFNKGVVLMFDKKDKAGAIKVWEELLTINPMATAPNGQPLKDLITEMKKKP